MDNACSIDSVLAILKDRGILAHSERIERRDPRFATLAEPLATPLPEVLEAKGFEQLYVHQCQAIEATRGGNNVVIVTGTASGKTLCYNLPVFEQSLLDPGTTAFYLFPTKALCQDQLGSIQQFIDGDRRLEQSIHPAIYDGDTPTTNRQQIKSAANVVLTNPDMLHVGILPYHAKWSRLLSRLRFVVIDEIHTYRGIFGANLAGLLRRLQRVCQHYGSAPQIIAASATIANPQELAEKLTGQSFVVVDDNGAPSGEKNFALVNPGFLDQDQVSRKSASDEATWIMEELLMQGAQTITFTRTRVGAELIYRYVRAELERKRSPLASQIKAYRGGYLPQERRAIEQMLFSGEARGVVSTNALELGIDVGALDAALLVGYPGTIASTWQQAGRAGRTNSESLAIFIAQNDPIDQYLMRHPRYFFSRNPEHAVIDPQNPYILQNHLQSGAFEIPLGPRDEELFGEVAPALLEILESEGLLNQIEDQYYATTPTSPALTFSLRHMSDNTFAIIEEMIPDRPVPELLNGFPNPVKPRSKPAPGRRSIRGPQLPDGYRLLATVDAISAPELVYPQAVYLHDARTYLVRELDLDAKLAYVERLETDYYTQAILESKVKVRSERERYQLPPQSAGGGASDKLVATEATISCFGDLDVSWKTVAFKKLRFETRENLGMGPVDIPAQNLETTGFWLVVNRSHLDQLRGQGYRPSEGLVGIRNLMIQSLPLIAMCDPRDISGVVDSSNLGIPAVFMYDRYPGGLGYTEKGYTELASVLAVCRDMVRDCGCDEGCPSCVGLPNLRPAIHSDPDLSRGFPIPDKAAAIKILESIRQ